MSYLRHFISAFFIAIFSLLIYANTFENGFTYDDYGTMVNNPFIKDLQNLPSLFTKGYITFSGEITYRPVATFTYFIDYALYGVKPWGYHLTNVLLHASNGILLYIFLTLLAKVPDLVEKKLIFQPLLVSLLFVSHPVLTEAVNAISFREDILAFFFYIAALSLYLIIRRNFTSRRNSFIYAVSCILYFLALLSKEMAATLPLIVYCYEWVYMDRGKEQLRSILSNWYNTGYIAITLAYLYLRFSYFYNPIEKNLSVPALIDRITTLPWLIVSFIKLTIFPVLLSADYEIVFIKSVFSPSFIVCAVIIFLVLGLAFMGKNREISFGTLFFIIALGPVYNIIPIAHPFAERYLYLPVIGFVIIAWSAIDIISETRKRALLIPLLIILSLYSLEVVRRNSAWRDQYSLWSDTVKKMPDSSMAHNNLGLVYYRQGRLGEAIQEINRAIKLKADDSEYHFALAQVYHKQGQLDLAMQEFITAINLKPDDERYHTSLGILYADEGRLDNALHEFEIAVRLNPDEPRIKRNLSLIRGRITSR